MLWIMGTNSSNWFLKSRRCFNRDHPNPGQRHKQGHKLRQLILGVALDLSWGWEWQPCQTNTPMFNRARLCSAPLTYTPVFSPADIHTCVQLRRHACLCLAALTLRLCSTVQTYTPVFSRADIHQAVLLSVHPPALSTRLKHRWILYFFSSIDGYFIISSQAWMDTLFLLKNRQILYFFLLQCAAQ